jgi:hypothetical protein
VGGSFPEETTFSANDQAHNFCAHAFNSPKPAQLASYRSTSKSAETESAWGDTSAETLLRKPFERKAISHGSFRHSACYDRSLSKGRAAGTLLPAAVREQHRRSRNRTPFAPTPRIPLQTISSSIVGSLKKWEFPVRAVNGFRET